jgi:hypothetical protein
MRKPAAGDIKNATAPGTNDVGEGSPRTPQNLPLTPERSRAKKKRKEDEEGEKAVNPHHAGHLPDVLYVGLTLK